MIQRGKRLAISGNFSYLFVTMSENEKALNALAEEGGQGVIKEIWHMLRTNKKWWLTPIVLVLLLVAGLVVLGGTGAAPFIYSIF